MPTIGAFVQHIPAGFETRGYRSTDGTVLVCLEGSGQVEVGEHCFDIAENDVVVIPSWQRLRVRAEKNALNLFSYSDRPVQQALGLWREERL